MSVWFVKPEDVRIDLSFTDPNGVAHPFWIRIKKALTVGEIRRVTTAGWRGMTASRGAAGEPRQSEIGIDWKVQTFARSEAYLLQWSLQDDQDRPVPLTREAIEALDPAVYELIENAITAHVEAIEQEKKRPTGSGLPSAMSA